MSNQTRGQRLLAQITHGLIRHGRERTAKSLGDRSSYVGLSDVSKAMTCLRTAVASKLTPHSTTTPITEDEIAQRLGRELTLQRGHWLEAGLEPALRANGTKLITQLEVQSPMGPVPLRAHLDFTLVAEAPRPIVRILELKSTAHLPDTLHAGYEAQVYGQVGLLATHWDQPVFRIRTEQDGAPAPGRTFPQLCREMFGMALPETSDRVDLEAWVLCLSMSQAKAFGPYHPNPTMLTLCQDTAAALWAATQKIRAGQSSLDQVAICGGFHPLCDWCEHADDCPKFKATSMCDPELDRQLAGLMDLKAAKTLMETQIQEEERRIRLFCQRQGVQGWLSTNRFRFRTLKMSGRKSLDAGRLRFDLAQRIGERETERLVDSVTTYGADYDRLSITPLSKPKQC